MTTVMTRKSFKFLHINGIFLMVFFWSIGIALLVNAIFSARSPEESGAALFVGGLFSLAGALVLFLHMLLHRGARDGAIKIVDALNKSGLLSPTRR